MKKLSILLIMGALCASILVGCTTETPTESGTASASEPAAPVSSTAEESSAAESSEPSSQTPAVTGDVSVEMLLDEQNGDSVGQFVKVVGADNAAVDEINNEIADLVREYKEESTEGDGSWAEYRTYTNKDSKYLNIVVHHNVYPTYGDQGDVDTFVYDIENQKLISKEEVQTMTGKIERAIVSAFEDYYRDASEYNQYRQITEFDIEGYSVYENGQADFYLLVETDDKDDAPVEYQTSSSKELYVFHSDDASIELLNFDNIFVNNGRQIF